MAVNRDSDRAERIRLAKKLWHEGDHATRRGDYSAALRLYGGAHDLVVDLPRWHRLAHEKLCAVHRRTGRWGRWARDNVLLITAPAGSFVLISGAVRAGRKLRTRLLGE